MSSWFTKVFPNTHIVISFAVYELNFIRCSEIVYSEFIEIICNAALCYITHIFLLQDFRIFTDEFQYLQKCCIL